MSDEVLIIFDINDTLIHFISNKNTNLYYDLSKDIRKESGTTITLHLNENGKEYASRWQIESLIKKYSDHIDFPISLTFDDIEYDDDGKEKSRKPKTEQINKAKAFWTRSKNDLKKKEYIDFYKSFSVPLTLL